MRFEKEVVMNGPKLFSDATFNDPARAYAEDLMGRPKAKELSEGEKWDEEQHPRDASGRFGEGGGEKPGGSSNTFAKGDRVNVSVQGASKVRTGEVKKVSPSGKYAYVHSRYNAGGYEHNDRAWVSSDSER